MQFTRKQFTAVFVLITLLTLASGLCYGLTVSAQIKNVVPAQSQMPDMGDCGESTISSIHDQITSATPLGSSIMPCCIERHENTPTTLPTILDERVNFSDVVAIVPTDETTLFVQKPTYISSPGPPLCPDILSSVLKKE